MTLAQRLKKHNTKHVDRSINLMSVFLKFNGKCQGCKCNVVMGIHPQVSNSATIEHIIPLASGGNHVWRNVELLCFDCNRQKNLIFIRDRKEVEGIANIGKKTVTIFSLKLGKFTIYIKKDIR